MTHCVRPSYCIGLFAEAEIFLSREHFVDKFSIKNGHLWPVSLQFLQQDCTTFLDLAPRQIRGAFRRSRHHVREADAEIQ